MELMLMMLHLLLTVRTFSWRSRLACGDVTGILTDSFGGSIIISFVSANRENGRSDDRNSK